MERSEDAGVYKLNDDLAFIQTLDFFTPIVDDPYAFGQIAVANALSDIYAMGGKPLMALNIVCFPINKLDISILKQILTGGLDKMREAGVTLAGGHSVEDDETKFGLSVMGIIHPDRVIFNQGAKPGDKLVLTKPLGTGIINTAIKGCEASPEAAELVIKSMSALNNIASELMTTLDVHACTDITGFGLLGHACEMIDGTNVGMKIYYSNIPYFEETRALADMGMIPGGLHRNREFRSHMVEFSPAVPQFISDILFDPQTSGGLLIALPDSDADSLLHMLHEEGIEEAAIIGEVIAEPKCTIIVE